MKVVRRELVEQYRRDQAIQSEIERELENQENQENIPPPAYVAPEPPAANRQGPRIVFGRLPVLPIPEEIRIVRNQFPERPRTPAPVFRYRYPVEPFLVPGQETDAPTSGRPTRPPTPDADLADVE